MLKKPESLVPRHRAQPMVAVIIIVWTSREDEYQEKLTAMYKNIVLCPVILKKTPP
jgi:hypothetical protein